MVEKKTIAITVAGIAVGSTQTFLLREYVDKVYGKIPGLEGLGGFGTYSSLGGIIGGGITTTVGLISVLTKKITKNVNIQLGLLGYGISALSGGVMSGLFPVTPPAGAGARLNKPAPNTQMQVKLKAAGKVPANPVSRGQVGTNRAKVNTRAGSQPVGQGSTFPLRT